MSVQTEINRISTAKEAIATAIAGKGVTVPDGTMLDGMAALIESIEAGSGESGGGTTLAKLGSGSLTGSGESVLTITHGLGVTPKVILITTTGAMQAYTIMQYTGVYCGNEPGTHMYYRYNTKTTASQKGIGSDPNIPNWNNETITVQSGMSSIQFRSTFYYKWEAFG